MTALLPPYEELHLAALYRYEALDTAFTRIVGLAAEVLDMSVASGNFTDLDRQWGKACFGLADAEAPRRDSCCVWAILENDMLLTEDTQPGPRFAGSPGVTGEPHVHLHAGALPITQGGLHVATLCVTTGQPHAFGERERRILREFAALLTDEFACPVCTWATGPFLTSTCSTTAGRTHPGPPRRREPLLNRPPNAVGTRLACRLRRSTRPSPRFRR